jgi:hypothetical protein
MAKITKSLEDRGIPLRIYIELAGLIFAAGVTYSAIQSNKSAIDTNSLLIRQMSEKLSDHDAILAQNVTEHHYMIKTLDELVEKLDPIVEVAIRGNEHMADDTSKGAHTRSGRH